MSTTPSLQKPTQQYLQAEIGREHERDGTGRRWGYVGRKKIHNRCMQALKSHVVPRSIPIDNPSTFRSAAILGISSVVWCVRVWGANMLVKSMCWGWKPCLWGGWWEILVFPQHARATCTMFMFAYVRFCFVFSYGRQDRWRRWLADRATCLWSCCTQGVYSCGLNQNVSGSDWSTVRRLL